MKKTENGKKIIQETYKKCQDSLNRPKEDQQNHLQDLYAPFSDDDISKELASLLKTDNISTDIDILFQSVEDLHKACPNHTGDWYFTGEYPTPGGNMVANKSFVYYIEGNAARAY